MLSIVPIPAFTDNYIWLITNSAYSSKRAFVVDPGDADPVIKHLEAHQLTLAGILLTHHHPDHVGGVEKLLEYAGLGVSVIGPYNEKIQYMSRSVKEDDRLEVLGVGFSVLEVPGHTLDHIAFYTDEPSEPALFCGDTLFVAGCGRIFEGTAAQMHESLSKLARLPGNTTFYCAHEYTLSNLRFAQAVEPESKELESYIEECEALRRQNSPTVPSTIAKELTINPFLRSDQTRVKAAAESRSGVMLNSPAEVFRVTREWKDNF